MQNLLLSKGPMGNKLLPLTHEQLEAGMNDGTLKRMQKGIYQAVVGGEKIIPESKKQVEITPKPKPSRAPKKTTPKK